MNDQPQRRMNWKRLGLYVNGCIGAGALVALLASGASGSPRSARPQTFRVVQPPTNPRAHRSTTTTPAPAPAITSTPVLAGNSGPSTTSGGGIAAPSAVGATGTTGGGTTTTVVGTTTGPPSATTTSTDVTTTTEPLPTTTTTVVPPSTLPPEPQIVILSDLNCTAGSPLVIGVSVEGTPTPTGTVEVSGLVRGDDPQQLDQSGQASFSLTCPTAARYPIQVMYGGDGNWLGGYVAAVVTSGTG